ncbi:MAG: PAS domain S-box protein, partial [Candidatus Hadarchaeum sp.]|uniref:PAS domain S-box protein n=1 Tax=Candidatus Hadarchaeum sp. TaxID=2883567 RepID=UPI003D111FB7
FFLRTISPVKDARTGEVKAVSVVGKDITKLKKALEELRKSREEYRSLADNVADILLRIDLQGNCTYISRNVEDVAGYTPDEVMKMNIKDVLTPDSYKVALARIKMWKEGAKRLPPYVVEVRTKDGRIVPFELKTSPIFEKGELKGFQILARDITERLEAARALERARAYAETIVETVHEPLVVLDAEMKVVSANRAFYECFKVTREETERYSLFDLGNRQWDIPELRRLLKDVVEKNTTFKEFVVVHDFPHIGRKIMMLNARQMRIGPTEEPMVLLAIEDITERQQMETQLKRSVDIQTAIVSLLSLPLKLSLEKLLKRALEIILFLPCLGLEQRGAIFLFDGEKNALTMKVQSNLSGPPQKSCASVPLGRCLCGKAALERKLIFADHVDENHETRYEGMTPHGHYCVPILAEEKLLGVLNLYVSEGHRRNEAEEEVLQAVANALALIIMRKNFEKEQLKFIYRTNELSPGECYLLRSHRAAYNIAAQLMLLGVPGICFTREAPEKLMEFGIPKENIILLSSVPLKDFEAIDSLQNISMRISEFVKNNRESIVLLDGLEYLTSRFGFDMVYKFLQEKRFNFIDSDAIFLLPVDLGVFSERERALLTSEIKILG